jgi:epoxide hydrolase-like predicted phosphatase
MIKVIIFDIGGVVLYAEDSLNNVFEQWGVMLGLAEGKSVEFHNKYLDRMLVGKISAKQYFATFKKEFKIKGDIEKLWMKIALKNIKLNKELLKIIDKLRKQYPIIVLSNVTETRSNVDTYFDLYSHFDKAFLSYKLKMVKPSKSIYQHVLKKMKVKPEEVLFIDDKEFNLRTARELGIRCIQFNNNAQLKTEFARIGLL